MMKRVIWLVLILFGLCSKSFAQSYTGCLYNGDIYTDTSIGNPSPTNYSFYGNSYSVGARCNNGTVVNCRVYYLCFGTCYYNGIKSTFSVANCPIDNWLWMLIFPVSFLSINSIRRKYAISMFS